MDIHHKQRVFATDYSRLFDVVYRYVRYRVIDDDEVEDVVSEIFMKGYDKLSDFDPERGTLQQWIFGIARNEVISHWRLSRRTVSLELVDEPEDKGIVSRLLDRLDHRLLTEKIFRRLSAEAKALVALRYAEGLTYEELAEVTGKEPAALRQYFSRLHRSLRLAFDEHVS